MSDEFNNRSFLNPEDVIGDPRDAFELWAKTVKNAAPFSTLNNPGYRKAIVLEAVEEMSAEEAEGAGMGPAVRRMTSYKYMVRLVDEWNEHMLLPQPCDPATSNGRQSDLGTSHLMVVGSHDTQFGTRLSINVGDYVDIDMEKGNFMKNLQRARHGSMSSRNSNRRSHGFTCLTDRNVSRNFSGMTSAPAMSQQQQDFEAALRGILGPHNIDFSVSSYTRSAAEQVRVMDNNAKRDISTLTQYVSSSPAGQAAARIAKRYNGHTHDADEKQALYDQAIALLEAVPMAERKGHMAGRALDIPTSHLSVEQVDQIRLAVKDLGGIVNLEPPKSGCWNQQGFNVHRDQYGLNTLKRNAEPGKGICAGEHICATWSASWTAPANS